MTQDIQQNNKNYPTLLLISTMMDPPFRHW